MLDLAKLTRAATSIARKTSCRRRDRNRPPADHIRSPSGERGFVLITVLLVVVVMVATVAVTLREATSGLKNAQAERSRSLAEGAAQHGLNMAMDRLQALDPSALAAPDASWDIFGAASTDAANDFVPGPLPYPTVGELQGALEVRVGLRPGQRTRAPAGEDVRSGYGYVVEVQISVRGTGFGNQAEERSVVGVRLPYSASHAN